MSEALPPRRALRLLAWLKVAVPWAVFGAIAATGLAPLGFWWASLLALGAMCWMLPIAASPRTAALRFWQAGTGYFGVALFWIVDPFLVLPEVHGWMAPFALLGMAAGMALFWGMAAAVGVWCAQGRLRLMAIAVAFVAAEAVRGVIFTGFPWAMIGHIWIDTPVAQLASHTGALGLSLLTLLAVALPITGTTLRQKIAISIAVAAALSTVWTAGAWRIASAIPEPSHVVQVRLVQPNAAQDEKWRHDLAQMFFDRQLYLSSSETEAQMPPPDLVVWSETAVPFLLEPGNLGLQMIADAAAPARTAIGIQRRNDAGEYFNSLAILGSDAAVQAVYDKHHLVPFGEYMPWAAEIFGADYAGFAARQLQGYSAGPGPRTLDLGDLGLVLPLICYEAVFPAHLRSEPRPDWVLQITNDAWFGSLIGPFQHLAQAQLRAIEQGLPVVRAANTGVSAVIDAHGQVLSFLPLNTMGVLDAAVPGALPATFYARWGDVPLWMALAAALLAFRLGRRARDD
jgi:apolipoprotein N-acyltransferase